MKDGYADLLESCKRFCDADPDVRALALIGSRSVPDGLSDEFSDLDLIVVSRDVGRFYAGADWLEALGEVWATFTESVSELGHWERRVVFAGGRDIDFVLVDAAVLRDAPDQLVIARDLCARGPAVLIDKDGSGAALSALRREPDPYESPTAERFSSVVNDFYFHYLWANKKLRRGELWVAIRCVDGYLNERLLKLIEWFERATRGAAYDTRYDGRFLERWADAEIREALSTQFCRYDAAEAESVLRAKEALFGDLARRTAAILGLPYPAEQFDALVAWTNGRESV